MKTKFRFKKAASKLIDCVNHLYSLDPDDFGIDNYVEQHNRAKLILYSAVLLRMVGVQDIFDEKELRELIENINKMPTRE